MTSPLSRRDFLKVAALTTTALSTNACNQNFFLNKKHRKPNIIYILADDLGYGDLGCYGQKKVKTPNLDKMAAEGMRFTQHYAGSTVCAPSRCAIMTGLHTGHCYIRGNSGLAMPKETVTIAKILKQTGYSTACIGK